MKKKKDFGSNSFTPRKLNYPWPKTRGVLSIVSEEDIKQAINENQEWFISEKLDGCNMSVSSAGWVASREIVKADLTQDQNFSNKKINQLNLEKIKPLFEKITALAHFFNTEYNFHLDLEKDEVILYGEFILPGTSTSSHDIYQYKLDGFLMGQMYAFGIGFLFKNQNNQQNKRLLQTYFPNVMELLSADEKETFFICPINKKTEHYFNQFQIDLVRFYPTEKFVNIFTKSKYKLLDKLESRLMEGYIIHDNTNKMLKWKYQVKPTDYYDSLIEKIENEWIENENQIKVASVLKKLYNYSKLYVTELDLNLFNYYYENFMSLHQEKFQSDLHKAQYNLKDNFDLKFCLQCWKNHAEAKIFHQLITPPKCLMDKTVSMEYKNHITLKLESHAKNFFLFQSVYGAAQNYLCKK